MKSMREMINLMEGVMAVPGIGEGARPGTYEVPAYQRKQKGEAPLTPKDVERHDKEGKLSDRENLKKAAQNLEEKSTSEKQARFMAACAHGADYDSCPPDKVSKEFNKADTGTKQLSNAMKEAHVDSCRQSNPDNAREACKMEETMYDAGFEESDEELEEDLQNGYNDQHYVSGNDYFPNGADSPVWRAVGPSGARHGDNPGQKKMKTEIDEVHKELVYGYRSFLGETAKKKTN